MRTLSIFPSQNAPIAKPQTPVKFSSESGRSQTPTNLASSAPTLASSSSNTGSSSRGSLISRVFSNRFQSAPKEFDVEMNNTLTARAGKRDILKTSGVMGCSAVICLADFDPKTNTYNTRMLSHVAGADLSTRDNQFGMATTAIQQMSQAVSRDPENSKVIIIHGQENRSAYAHGVFTDQPALAALKRALPSHKFEEKQFEGGEIKVFQNGTVTGLD